MESRTIPEGKINLRLIMPAYGESCKAKDFLLSPNDSASDIAQYVFDNWPDEWSDQIVQKPHILRLIYQGRFLHEEVTLADLQLPVGKTTVMHLVARENLPKLNSQENCSKSKDPTNGCSGSDDCTNCNCLGSCSII